MTFDIASICIHFYFVFFVLLLRLMIVEQDHRAIKRLTRPMLNLKSFRAAHCVLAGVELMHMIRKGQFAINGADAMSFADQFYALAGKIRPV